MAAASSGGVVVGDAVELGTECVAGGVCNGVACEYIHMRLLYRLCKRCEKHLHLLQLTHVV